MRKLYVKEDKSRGPSDLGAGAFVTFPNLKPSSTSISLRLPNLVLAQIKVEAHRRGVPYQAHIKSILADALTKR
jgi:predicted DNA binding CopG/RHH family protein